MNHPGRLWHRSHTLRAVAAGALLGLASLLPAPPAGAQTAPGAGALPYLRDQVAAGRLDEPVLRAVAAGPDASALLLLEDDDLLRAADQRRRARGLDEDDPRALDENARAYDARKRQALAGAAGRAQVLEDYPHFGVQHVRFADAAALEVVLRRPEVRGVRENGVHVLQTAQSLPLIGQPAAQAIRATGAGRAVAVVDTGVDYTQAAFGACTAPATPSPACRVAAALDLAADDGALDDHGHGTNVAAIALAVAPQTKILALDVFTKQSSGQHTTTPAKAIAALEWVLSTKATHKTVAVNLSLGTFKTYHTATCAGSPYTSVFANLNAAGVRPVVASGNDARAKGAYTDGVSMPACTPGAISVGAVYDESYAKVSTETCTDTNPVADQIACFSQSGPTLTLLAPGAVITAGGKSLGGTSQAAPHVAGAVAALSSKCASTVLPVKLTGYGKPITDARNGVTTPRLDLGKAAANPNLCLTFVAP